MRIRERIGALGRRAAITVLSVLSASQRVRGILVIDAGGGADSSSRIDKVAGSLDLIAQHAPALLRRISKHLEAVVINNSRTGYLPSKRLCILNSEKLDKGSVEEAALALAHETTHAVLDQAGFSYEPSERERIEHACVRAEQRLLRKLPNGAALTEIVLKKLTMVWWEDVHLNQGRERDLRAAGVPEWLIRLRRLTRE